MDMTMLIATKPPVSSPALISSSSRPTQPAICIKHPETGQLLAPGSKVWAYYVDDSKFGRVWIGQRTRFPGKSEATAEITETSNIGNKKDVIRASDMERLTPVIHRRRKAPSNKKQVTPSAITSAPSTMINPVAGSMTRFRSKGDIDLRYAELHERKTDLRRKGRIEESNIIQAATNVGIMLGWNRVDVLGVVERLERRFEDSSEQHYNSKMMEVMAEVERLKFRGEWKELQNLRRKFEGHFYDVVDGVEALGKKQWRAPGFMMLLQSAINVAFLKGLDRAAEVGKLFDKEVFDSGVVYQFRIPNKDCGEEKTYLMQMSQLGAGRRRGGRIAACPGIERAIKEIERKTVLEKVRDQIDQGRELIRLTTKLFGKLNKPAVSVAEKAGVTQFAMENLDDEGLLVLDFVYRKKVGFPILVGDEVDNEEEEEEEDDDEGSEGMALDRGSAHEPSPTSEQIRGDNNMPTSSLQPSLVVLLKYRR